MSRLPKLGAESCRLWGKSPTPGHSGAVAALFKVSLAKDAPPQVLGSAGILDNVLPLQGPRCMTTVDNKRNDAKRVELRHVPSPERLTLLPKSDECACRASIAHVCARASVPCSVSGWQGNGSPVYLTIVQLCPSSTGGTLRRSSVQKRPAHSASRVSTS